MQVPDALVGAPADPGGNPTVGFRVLWRGACAAVVAAVGILTMTVPAGAASAPTGPASPAGRVTFGIEPAPVGGAAVRPNFSFSATPGGVVNDDVRAVNYSSTPLTLQIYATDAVETSGGGFGLLPADQKPKEVGSWIALAPGSATVQVPGESLGGPGTVVVPFTVHIPAKATPGDHVGGIVASLQTTGTNATGQRIVLDQRIGTRVFLRVAGPLAPQLAVTDLHPVYEGTANPLGKGEVRVSYLVSNTGNVDLGVEQSIAVSGLIGDNHQVQLAKVPLLLAGTSVRESAVVSGVWPQFLLHQTVTARPVAVAGSAATGLVPVTASASVWAVPWTLLILIVLIVLLVLLAVRTRRRRTARRRSEGASGPPVVSGAVRESSRVNA